VNKFGQVVGYAQNQSLADRAVLYSDLTETTTDLNNLDRLSVLSQPRHQLGSLVAFTAKRHAGSGVVSYTDGHAEIHR